MLTRLAPKMTIPLITLGIAGGTGLLIQRDDDDDDDDDDTEQPRISQFWLCVVCSWNVW